MTDILAVSLLRNFDRSHTQCNAYSLHLEQTILYRVNVQLIFKNVREIKRLILNINLKKIPETNESPHNGS